MCSEKRWLRLLRGWQTKIQCKVSKQRILKGKVKVEMKEFELSQKSRPSLGETGKAEAWEMQMLQGEVQEDRTPACGDGIGG